MTTTTNLLYFLLLLLVGALLNLLFQHVKEASIKDDKVSLVVLLPLGQHILQLLLCTWQLLLKLFT